MSLTREDSCINAGASEPILATALSSPVSRSHGASGGGHTQQGFTLTAGMLTTVVVALLPAWQVTGLTMWGDCEEPHLEHGWIEAQDRLGTDSFVGRFHCQPGFLLSGEELVKCRGGVWSQRVMPVCTSLGGCTEHQLPAINNGFRRGVVKLKNSVFR